MALVVDRAMDCMAQAPASIVLGQFLGRIWERVFNDLDLAAKGVDAVLGFEDCIHALCGKIEVVKYPFPYPSKELSEYDTGWRLCHAIHGPIYNQGHKDDSLAWKHGQRVWGQE